MAYEWLARDLRIKAAMIRMGEKIAPFSECDLMEKAAEGKGLRQLTRDSCDHLVRLDMNGPIRSLNVSNACAVTLYALTR